MTDIVHEFAADLNAFKLSELIATHKRNIIHVEYNTDITWKQLKQFWCSTCSTYAMKNNKQFINNHNVIVWDDLITEIKSVSNTRLENAITEERISTHYELHAQTSKQISRQLLQKQLESPFMETNSILDKAFIIQTLIREYRRDATYVPELHKQDLLYYGIVDLVKDGDCSSKSILKEDYVELKEYMKDYLRFDGVKHNQAKAYSKILFKKGDIELKKALKEEKNLLRNNPVDDKPLKKNIIKLGKLLCTLTDNCTSANWLYETMTEPEFTTRFVTPLIDLILKPYRPLFTFKPGEQKLLMVKEYENSALSEEDTRLPGPDIDGIIRIPKLNLDFVLVEVSGPPCAATENYSHYKGDRNKIAKYLKYMFKIIISKKGTPCFRTVTRLKLFGLHLYKDIIYVYSVSMPMWDVPVFKVETSIKIPVEPVLFPSTMPKFISKLFDLGEKIDHFAKEVEGFLATTDYEEDSDSSGSNLSSCSVPTVSSKKRKSLAN